jgi:mono/diheme cytochrome c family protein
MSARNFRISTLLLLAVFALTACERDRRDMYDQARMHPDQIDSEFADGRNTRAPPTETIAHSSGPLAASTSGRAMQNVDATIDRAHRGRERYDIFCAPCHSVVGDGDGMIVRRGFPHPPTLHSDEARNISDTRIDSIIRNGIGRMVGYDERISASDRAAIVDYIRILQRSQHASISDLTRDDRDALEKSR